MTIAELQNKIPEYKQELSENERAKRTAEAYISDVSAMFEWLLSEGGRTGADELTKSDVISYKEKSKADGLKTTTINRRIVSINKFLNWAGAGNAAGVKALKQQARSSLNNVLTRSEYERLLNATINPGKQAQASGMKPDIQAHVILQTLAGTGCRFGELEYFTVEALREAPNNGNTITVVNKGKEREITIEKDLQKLLKEYCRQQNITKGYIFCTRNGTPISNPQLSRKLKKIAGYARINKDKIHPHNFRHLFAKSYLESNPGRIDDLKDILGHGSIATTAIYTRTSHKEKSQAIHDLGLVNPNMIKKN